MSLSTPAKSTHFVFIPFWKKGVAAALLILAVLVVYRNSLGGVFVFDDVSAILENPTLRPPIHWGNVLFAPGDEAGTVGGRPLVNLTLALNYAFGGLRVEGYHAVNIALHLLSTLLLFGIVARTFSFRQDRAGKGQRPEDRSSFDHARVDGFWVALVVALLWAVHPLQTESVTYIVQRAESLMGLFYLLTLYSFIRFAQAETGSENVPEFSGIGKPTTQKRRWLIVGVCACLLGMATKEVMVTAPLAIFLYDWTFVSAGFAQAWKSHAKWHVGLAGTWILLAALVASTHGRGGSVGFGSAPVWPYLLTQAHAVTHYLGLAFWPAHLVLDYGTGLIHHLSDVLAPASFLVLLVLASFYAFRKHPTLGFLGLVFFLLLAPSSSILPIATEPQAEHRMYLPLAIVISVVVIAGQAILTKLTPRFSRFILGGVGLAAAIALGSVTVQRNDDYRSEIALWSSTVENAPQNPRAHNNLAQALLAEKNDARAFDELSAAVNIDSNYTPAQYNLGAMLLDANRPAEAIPHLEKALAAPLHQTETHLYLGEAYEKTERPHDAAEAFRIALQLDPKNPEAAFGLGNNLAREGNLPAAVDAFRIAVHNAPDRIRIRNNLANALLFSGRVDEALTQYREALALDPNNTEIRENLDRAEAQLKAMR